MMTPALVLLLIAPKSQVIVLLPAEKLHPTGVLMSVTLLGRMSLRVTLVALSGPLLLTPIV